MANQDIQKQSTPAQQKVSAGEVCSIDIAKKYGFYDKDHYYTSDYSEVKTYSEIDEQEGRESNAICKQTDDGNTAYPLCSLVYGIPYEQDRKDPSKCIVNIREYCPSENIKGKSCKRSNIMLPAPVAMQTHCDEKITDWYMIPNYHLGNKYNFIQKKSDKKAQCMKPCPVDKVPGYVQDPVDNSSAGPLANTSLMKCYNKKEYMGGKYKNTENFCPIAWVHRLGQKQEDIADDIINKINESGASNTYKKIAITVANNEANKVYVDSKRLLENIDYPNDATLEACSKLHTPERVSKAYDICKDIYDNPNSIDKINIKPVQQKVLTKACHILFCNENEDLSSSISASTNALCFPSVEDLDANDMLSNDKKIDIQSNTDASIGSPPKIAELISVDKGTNALKGSLSFVILILIVSLLIFFMVISWDEIKQIVLRIKCFIVFLWQFIVPWVKPDEMERYQDNCKLQLSNMKNGK